MESLEDNIQFAIDRRNQIVTVRGTTKEIPKHVENILRESCNVLDTGFFRGFSEKWHGQRYYGFHIVMGDNVNLDKVDEILTSVFKIIDG